MNIAAIDAYQIGTVISLLLTAGTGFLVWYASKKSANQQGQIDKNRRSADLVKAEVEGWEALINTLSKQYDISQRQNAMLRQQIVECGRRVEALEEEVDALKAKIRSLTRKLNATA